MVDLFQTFHTPSNIFHGLLNHMAQQTSNNISNDGVGQSGMPPNFDQFMYGDIPQQKKKDMSSSTNFMKLCVGKVLADGAKVPECDPVAQETRKTPIASNIEYGAAAAFNSTAMNFLMNMLKIFKNDFMLMKTIQELKKYTSTDEKKAESVMFKLENVKPVNVPSLLFARSVQKVVTLRDGSQHSISDLIIDKNIELLDCVKEVELLSMLDLPVKYEKLNEQNRTYVWNTINKLLMSASMVVMVEHDNMGCVDDLISGVFKKGKKLAMSTGGRMGAKDAAHLISMDKDVQNASKKLMRCMNVAQGAEADIERQEQVKEDNEVTQTVDKICASDMTEYIKEATGKTIDLMGLADENGNMDMSEEGISKLTNALMARQVAGNIPRSSPREDAIRERLRQKLAERKKRAVEAKTATACVRVTTATTAGTASRKNKKKSQAGRSVAKKQKEEGHADAACVSTGDTGDEEEEDTTTATASGEEHE